MSLIDTFFNWAVFVGALPALLEGLGVTVLLGAVSIVAGTASGLAMALRWVLAEALIAEFCPSDQRGRYVGIFQTMVSATFIIGPALLVWLGTQSSITLWVVNGLNVIGLAWTLLIPQVPAAHDTGTARVGHRGAGKIGAKVRRILRHGRGYIGNCARGVGGASQHGTAPSPPTMASVFCWNIQLWLHIRWSDSGKRNRSLHAC